MVLKGAVLQRKERIENKRTDGASLGQKARGWEEVTNDFNSHPNVTKRTTNQLKKGWENMKTRRKLELATEKRERMKTGGGLYTTKIPDDPDMHSIGINIEMATDAVDSDTVYPAECDILFEQEEVFVGKLDPRPLFISHESNPCETQIEKSKEILKGVSGLFRSGELTAIMGPSGAGKSSLLNILTGFHVAGMGGQIKFNGEAVNPGQKGHRKMSCYIMQDDFLNPHFTVAEIMKIAAHLKLGDGLPGKAKAFVVEEILDSLGLSCTKDTKCCRLSGGQKKRLCIALELLDNPPIVFLDEPTTGLDSSSTVQLVTVLKGLAKCGRTIVCTIHQPSASVFELFDHTYMLSNGECYYQGSSKNVVPFLQTIGLACPMYHNPADFVLDVLNGDFGHFGEAMKLASKDPTWRIPPTPLDNAMEKPPTVTDENAKTMVLLNSPSEITRYWILLKRNLVQLHRDWTSIYLKIAVHMITGIITGCLFTNAGHDGSKSLSNLGYLMAVVVYQSFTSVMPAVLKIPGEIDVLRKEQFNNWYKLSTYYLAFLSSRLPAELFNSMFFVIVSYYLSGQILEIERFLKFILICNFVVLISECIGVTLGTVTNPVNGTFWGSVLLAVLILLGGYLAILTHMPRLLYYISYGNFMRYSFQGLVYSVYGDHRAIMPCPKEEYYCHLRYPEKLLSEIGMLDVNYWNDATCLSGITLAIAFYSYYSLCRNIKSRT